MLRLALIINVIIWWYILIPIPNDGEKWDRMVAGRSYEWHDFVLWALLILIAAWPKKCDKCGHRHVRECRRKVFMHNDYYECGCRG